MSDTEIFEKGMENDIYVYERYSVKRDPLTSFKITLFLIFGIMFSCYKNVREENIAWVNGNRGYEKFFEGKDLRIIHHGSFFSNIIRFGSHTSIFTSIPRLQRIKILFDFFKSI